MTDDAAAAPEDPPAVITNRSTALIVVIALVVVGLIVAGVVLASVLGDDADAGSTQLDNSADLAATAVVATGDEGGADGVAANDSAVSPAATAVDTVDQPVDTSEDGGTNLLGGDDPEDRLMPDVVCMDLQEAQDEIQDHGVFFSRSEDATGEGRRQLFDRNWVVVAQDPAPGEPIGEREALLSVVKDDETDVCG